MYQLIDLTQEFTDHMPVYGGDESARLFPTKSLEVDGYNLYTLHTNLHVGTHIDVPMHLVSNDTYVSEYTLDRFIGHGCLLDVRGQGVMTYQPDYEEQVKEQSIVLLYTGHDSCFREKAYYHNHPVMDDTLAEFFIRKNIKMICLDTPSPDHAPYAIHKLLLEQEIFIVENATHFEQLLDVQNFEIIAFPLKLRAEASLVRVVAKIKD